MWRPVVPSVSSPTRKLVHAIAGYSCQVTLHILINSAPYCSDVKRDSVTRQERGPCRQSRCEFSCHTERHFFDIAFYQAGLEM